MVLCIHVCTKATAFWRTYFLYCSESNYSDKTHNYMPTTPSAARWRRRAARPMPIASRARSRTPRWACTTCGPGTSSRAVAASGRGTLGALISSTHASGTATCMSRQTRSMGWTRVGIPSRFRIALPCARLPSQALQLSRRLLSLCLRHSLLQRSPTVRHWAMIISFVREPGRIRTIPTLDEYQAAARAIQGARTGKDKNDTDTLRWARQEAKRTGQDICTILAAAKVAATDPVEIAAIDYAQKIAKCCNRKKR